MAAGTRQPASAARSRNPASGVSKTAKSASTPPAEKSEFQFKCFFKHRDPLHTERLSPRYTSCHNVFPSVNRLREHTVRAHSLSHNCPECRCRITKKDKEQIGFWTKHRAGCVRMIPPAGGSLPTLLDEEQTERLSSLNLHFCKPNTEPDRCEKLWNALFPHDSFDTNMIIRTSDLENQQNQLATTKSAQTPKKQKKASPSTPPGRRAGAGNSLPTPAPSPPTRAEADFPPVEGMSDTRSIFSQVPVPKGPVQLRRGEESLVDSAVYMEDDNSVSGDAGQKESSPPPKQQGQSRRGSMRLSSPEYSPESPRSQYMDLEVPGIDSEIAPPDRPPRIQIEEEEEDEGDEEENARDEHDDCEDGDDDDDDMLDDVSCDDSECSDTESSVVDDDDNEMEECHDTNGRCNSLGELRLMRTIAHCLDPDDLDDMLNGREDSEEDTMSIDSACFS